MGSVTEHIQAKLTKDKATTREVAIYLLGRSAHVKNASVLKTFLAWPHSMRYGLRNGQFAPLQVSAQQLRVPQYGLIHILNEFASAGLAVRTDAQDLQLIDYRDETVFVTPDVAELFGQGNSTTFCKQPSAPPIFELLFDYSDLIEGFRWS